MTETKAEWVERTRRQAMRDHPFEGEREYCDAWIEFAPSFGPDSGILTGRMGCGYPRDLHPDPVLTDG